MNVGCFSVRLGADLGVGFVEILQVIKWTIYSKLRFCKVWSWKCYLIECKYMFIVYGHGVNILFFLSMILRFKKMVFKIINAHLDLCAFKKNKNEN